MAAEGARDGTGSRPIPAMPPRPPRRLPTLAFLKQAARNTIASFDDELFGELVVARWYGLVRIVFVSDPEGIRHVLVDNGQNYDRLGLIRRVFGAELGTGTLASTGDVWRRHQQVATPSLDRRAFSQDVPDFLALAEQSAEQLEARFGTGSVNLERAVLSVSTPLVNRFVSGGDPDALPVLEWFYKSPRRLGLLDFIPMPEGLLRRLTSSARNPNGAESSNRQLRAMLDARRADDYAGPRDLFWRLVKKRARQTGQPLPPAEARDEAANLLAGVSVGTRALMWLWYLLALHPQVEERLHEELDRVLGNGPMRPEHLRELTYLQQILDEVMRLYPPIPLAPREAKQPDVICGHPLPGRGLAMISPWITHRHRKLWDDPDRFDPDRFAPDQVAGRPRYAFIPFGAGPRVCPGKSFALIHMAIVAAAVARRFRVRFASEEPVTVLGMMSLRPRGGLFVRFERR